MLRKLFPALSCFLVSTALCAQTVPAAEGGGAGSFWIGGSFTIFNPDFGCPNASPFSCGTTKPRLVGPTIHADMDHTLVHWMGMVSETRFLSWSGPVKGMSESSYLGGPKFPLFHFRHIFTLNSKIPLGFGHISLPKNAPGTGSYFVYAPGASADYRVTRRISARADYEYQFWPGFKSVRTSFTTGTGGITPNGFSLGVSYAVR